MVDQWNRIECPEIDPHISSVVFWQRYQSNSKAEVTVFSNVLEQLDNVCGKK